MFLLTLVIFAVSSCSKEPKMIIRDGKAVEDDNSGNNNNNNNNNNGYTWNGCSPKPLVYDGSQNLGSGVYSYDFHVSLDNSQANANGVTFPSISFPHVGAGGTIIYTNATGDATYKLTKIENGLVYFQVITNNCSLKFNLSIGTIWFSANGNYTQNIGVDDGYRNYYYINFQNGSISPAF